MIMKGLRIGICPFWGAEKPMFTPWPKHAVTFVHVYERPIEDESGIAVSRPFRVALSEAESAEVILRLT